jgi:hypothetical protein
MKKYALIFIFIFYALLSYAQIDTATYYLSFGDSSIEYFSEIQPTYDKGYIAVGTTSSTNGTASDVYVVKLDSLFNKQWSKHFGSSFLEVGKSIIQTLDSNYIFCGYTNKTQNGDYDIWIEKIDRQGNFIWEKFLGGNDWDFANQMKELPDSSLIICGTTYSFSNNADGYLLRVDKNGNLLWEKNIGSAARDELNGLTFNLKKTEIIAVGETDKNFTTDSTDIYFVKTDILGNLIIDTTYGGSKFDNALQVTSTFDSAFVTIGSSNSQYLADLDYYSIKIDKNNTLQWQFTGGHNGSYDNDDKGVAITTKNQNIVFAINTKTYGQGKTDIMLVEIDNWGNWINKNNTFGQLEDELANDVLVANGHYILAGKTNSMGYGQFDALIIYKDTISSQRKDIFTEFKDTILTGINNNNLSLPKISVYPNPVTSTLNFKNLPKGVNFIYTITNTTGKLICKGNLTKNNSINNLNTLPSGYYYVSLKSLQNNQLLTFKFLKL